METFLNQIRIQQGEAWTIDKYLSQSQTEYVPFVVTNRENPHFVVTVASTKFEKNNRYVESWWLAYNGPMFFQSTPYDIGELSAHPATQNDISATASGEYAADKRYLYRYTLSTDEIDEELEHKPYYYVYIVYDEDAETDVLVRSCDYTNGYLPITRLLFTLQSTQNDMGTANWGSQNYMYQITLVSGQTMEESIRQAKNNYSSLNWRPDWPADDELSEWLEKTQQDVFKFIKSHIPGYFSSDIDWDSPLGQIWEPKVILAPTKLQVDNNLRKII